MSEDISVININSLYTENNKYTNDIDFKKTVEKIGKAASTKGFFYVTTRFLHPLLLLEIFKTSKSFFELNIETKEKWKIGTDPDKTHQGYGAIGMEKLGHSEDCKESFDLYDLNSQMLVSIDKHLKGFSDQVKLYHKNVREVGLKLLTALALYLDESPDFFTRHFGPVDNQSSEVNMDKSVIRLLHYPASSIESRDSRCFPEIIAGAHTDYGCLTLLNQDLTGGLQVYDSKASEFINVDPIPGTLVVNIGDLMQRWSNDVFCSAKHRVIRLEPDINRFSIPLFLEPHPETVVEPVDPDSRYSPVISDRYISSRFKATYNYLTKESF